MTTIGSSDRADFRFQSDDLTHDRQREHPDVVRTLLTHKVEGEANVSNTAGLTYGTSSGDFRHSDNLYGAGGRNLPARLSGARALSARAASTHNVSGVG